MFQCAALWIAQTMVVLFRDWGAGEAYTAQIGSTATDHRRHLRGTILGEVHGLVRRSVAVLSGTGL